MCYNVTIEDGYMYIWVAVLFSKAFDELQLISLNKDHKIYK